jgi:2-polyprenyl-3-methyl-5-hydroxy-6-metoxy-1,4-benzoquinol methylase
MKAEATPVSTVSVNVIEALLAAFADGSHSILEIGCGDGVRLEAAAKRGWKCFGVEPQADARANAQTRLGAAGYVVEGVSDLIPHAFHVVILPHQPSLQQLLYQLFSIGAITANTRVAIAGGGDALTELMQRLHFTAVDARNGIVVAHGSDFTGFMQERYVPGTFSKLAEYEHIPRYALAKTLVKDKAALDFGCGTGYGAAILGEVAKSVTGLDIDAAALAWARKTHANPRLDFQQHADLGATLPAASFDIVTCFEMIEHVDFETQKATIASIARLLKQEGLLLISTPNPDVTALYGANPYHLREMNEAEFRELLGAHFPHIRILRQYVRVGIAIGQDDDDAQTIPGALAGAGDTKPLAFIALCSRAPLPDTPNRVLFDHEIDYILQFMRKEDALNKARLAAYHQAELAQNKAEIAQSLDVQLNRAIHERDTAQSEVRTTLGRLSEAQVEIQTKNHELNVLENRRLTERAEYEAAIAARDAAIAAKAAELDTLQRIRADELSSPRFLARQLWHATRARLRAKLGGKSS